MRNVKIMTTSIFFCGMIFVSPASSEPYTSHGLLYQKESPSPIGETSYYKLLREESSRSLRSGTFVSTIASYNQDDKTYTIEIKYNLQTVFSRYKGTKERNIPERYLSEGFIPEIREKKIIKDKNFTITHLGSEYLVTSNGIDYGHCDKISISDFKKEGGLSNELILLENAITSAPPLSLRDSHAIIYLSERLGGLSAAKIIAHGRVFGAPIVVTLEYDPRDN